MLLHFSEDAMELCEARSEDREILVRLLDDYLRELAAHRERPAGATSAHDYPYLDAYFSDTGRHAFVIRQRGSVAGFTFIRGPASTGHAWEVAEFYIVPHSRGEGIGGAALASIWRRFPGDWELQVHLKNATALKFWLACVNKCAVRAPEVSEVDAADGRRFVLRFRIDVAGRPAP